MKILLAGVVLCAAVSGCAGNGATGASASASSGGAATGKHAECLVCKHENDLACVDVEVDDKTQRATIGGRDYYFCSESCKRECERRPEKYLRP